MLSFFIHLRHLVLLLRLGFLLRSHKVSGERLVRLLERMGPSFVKLGQTLSTRPDIIGVEYAHALASLRDSLPPFPFRDIERSVEQAFGVPISRLFSEVDDTPIAAASVAQVHKAVTKDGTTVALKVLRPGIEARFLRDIRFFYWCARLIERLLPQYRRLKPMAIVRTLEASVQAELDLRLEAASADELRAHHKQDPMLYIPKVYWNLTARRVLTTEWVEGIALHHVEALSHAGYDLKLLSTRFAVSFFNQAYRDGVFHADLHPGNVFVNAKQQIVLVDFGIMGRLDEANRLYVAQILKGFVERDYDFVAQVHIDAGYIPEDTDLQAFSLACRAIGEPIVGQSAADISIARLLEQLFSVTEQFDMETQPQLLLLQKTLVLVEGVGSMLYRDMNMWQLAEPWIREWAKSHLGLEAQAKRAARHAKDLVCKLPMLVDQVTHFVETSTTQGIKLHPDTLRAYSVLRYRRMGYFWLNILGGSFIGGLLTFGFMYYLGG